MAARQFKLNDKDFIVKVDVRGGKPVVSNNGMIALNKPYKKCTQVDADVFYEKFNEVVA